jgi:1,2-diacylglycerol 3-alpha-glucosyltransferase
MLKVINRQERPFAGTPCLRSEENRAVQPIRIGFFTEIYRPVVNGVVASVDALADGLRSRGHEVFTFAPYMPGNEEAGGVLRMPSLPLPTNTAYRLTLPVVSRRNRNRVIKRLSLIHVHSPFVTGWMGLRYARRYGIPLVYTYHTQLEAYAHYIPFEPNATRFAASQLTRAFANQADAVVVPTPAMAARLRELGVTAKLEIVPSGIDIARFGSGRRDERLRKRLGASNADRMLLYVGRLGKEKNVELLLEALALAADDSLKLIVAGDGPIRHDLERRAAECGVAEKTCFLGAVPRDELPDLYASADAFVMPSTTETQGLVIAEALAAGTGIIAADAPQNREVLGGAGRLVPPEARAFAQAFRSLDQGRQSPAAVRDAGRRFSIEAQAESIEALYAGLIRAARIA